ncbi:MAG: hypothetical protein A4E35_01318 [Methanoregula sp. PtaU1.Bin051]|nr:MAG: hypothetical protein A4E35_01318 [Methanoregula sp. PtaU1.Bin051]
MIEVEMQRFLAGFAVEQLDPETDRVTTPFSDRDGRSIRIYVNRRGSQFYLSCGNDRTFGPDRIGRSARQDARERLREVLRRFDVYHINGEISTEATKDNLPVRLKNLLQALILLDVMF